MNTVIADIESNGLLPDLTTIHCLAVSGSKKADKTTLYANHPGYPALADGLDRLLQADRVVFHNGGNFDLWALGKVYGRQHLQRTKLWDTLTVSRLVYADRGQHALAAWGERLGFPKGDYSKEMKAEGRDPWAEFNPRMGDYCVQDVEVTKRVYWHLQSFLKNELKKGWDWREAIQLEHDVAWIIAQQEQHGFRLDIEGATALAGELAEEKHAIEQELIDDFGTRIVPSNGEWLWKERRWRVKEYVKPKRRMRRWVACDRGAEVKKGVRGYYEQTDAHDPKARTGGYAKIESQVFNPGSRQQCVFRLTERHSWKPTKFTDTAQPAIDEKVLADLRYPEAKKLLRLFRLSKQLGQIADGDSAWLKHERNGYVHGAVNTNGAVTGRMTHFAPNMAQVDKKDPRMRGVWLPDAGHKLVGCDAEGLELRMLAHYLARKDSGEYARAVVYGDKSDGTDAHSRTQKLTALHSRDSAKTLMYAFLYGAGDPKLGLTIHQDAREAGHKPGLAKTPAGKKARAAMESGITGLGDLVKEVKGRAKTPGCVRGVDGRRVYIRSPHAALNTLLQSAGGLVMKKALVIFHYEIAMKAGWVTNDEAALVTEFHYCAQVHDEAQLSVPPSVAEEVGAAYAESIRLAGVRFGVRCPLSGAYILGDNWQMTH